MYSRLYIVMSDELFNISVIIFLCVMGSIGLKDLSAFCRLQNYTVLQFFNRTKEEFN